MTGGGLVSAPVLRPPDPAPDSTVFAYRLKSAATVATRFFQRWMVFERPATCRFAVTARSKGCGASEVPQTGQNISRNGWRRNLLLFGLNRVCTLRERLFRTELAHVRRSSDCALRQVLAR
jgi:hypothetical protein